MVLLWGSANRKDKVKNKYLPSKYSLMEFSESLFVSHEINSGTTVFSSIFSLSSGLPHIISLCLASPFFFFCVYSLSNASASVTLSNSWGQISGQKVYPKYTKTNFCRKSLSVTGFPSQSTKLNSPFTKLFPYPAVRDSSTFFIYSLDRYE